MTTIQAPVWDIDKYAPLLPEAGFIKDYATYATGCTDAPPLYHIISAIGIASVMVAPQSDLLFRGQLHPLHLFLLIVGDSSRSRKSSAIKRASRVALPVFKPLSQHERLWWPAASSPEGIIDELAAEPNRLLMLSEWTDMARLGRAQYWQHQAELLNTLYDALDEITRVRSKGVKVRILRPRVSLLAASTPDLVTSATMELDWMSGKMARYLVACARRPPEKEMEAESDDPDVVERLRMQLGTLVGGLPPFIGIHPSAWEVLRAWRNDAWWRDLEARAPRHLAASFGRAQEHVFRIAALYEATAMPLPFRVEISPHSMQAACNLVETCMDSLVQTFTVVYDDDRSGIAKVLALLRAAGDNGLDRSTLLRRAKNLTAKSLTDVIGTLKERGELREEVWRTKGRSGVRYFHVLPDEE